MGYPIWKTPPGDLGKISELEFYNFLLEASDPSDGYTINYSLQAGRFPPGIQLDPLGSMAGQPVNERTNIGGVPTNTPIDKTYKFTVRAQPRFTTTYLSGGNSTGINSFQLSFDAAYPPEVGQIIKGRGIPVNTKIKKVTMLTNTTATVTINSSTITLLSGTYVLLDPYVNDRAFTITITGNKNPELLTGEGYTPPVSIGKFLDGSYVEIPLEAVDPDIGDVITWSISDGELPTGLSLSSDGVISGVAVPYVNLPEGASTGWDDAPWDDYPWQFSTLSATKSYTFTVTISDGKAIDKRRYVITIISHNNLRTDNVDVTTDYDVITTDNDEKRPPVLLSETLGTYATYKSDNYFAFKFDAVDYDEDTIKYTILSDSAADSFDGENYDMVLYDKGAFYALPGTVTLNEDTGWLIGYIPPQLEPEQKYVFSIQVYKSDYPSYITTARVFTLTVLGSLDLDINWDTGSNLGAIQAGEVSRLGVSATSNAGLALTYSLQAGSRLPEGLKLLNDGTISGRCSFQSFSIDGGTTTFDVVLSDNGFVSAPTVFDKTYYFTVIATNNAGTASSERAFTLKVDIRTPEPYENIYVRCLADMISRNKFLQIVENSEIFQPDLIYRSNDPFWGRRRDITMLAGYGITASTPADYIAAMINRHYDKKYFFGEYGTSIAKDQNENPIYEVIWVELIEQTRAYVKGIKQSTPSGVVDLRKRIIGFNNPNYDSNDPTGYELKINDEVLMRKDISEALGTTNPAALPAWMTSIQADGTVSGYVTKVPLAYVNVGEGDKILFLLKKKAAMGSIPDIREIPFIADRYILDDNLSRYFDTTTKKFVPHHYTTFDLDAKLPTEAAVVATVDFAVDIPFDQINGHTTAEIEALGGLDGVVTPYEGLQVVFATQEIYIGFNVDSETQGWKRYNQYFDDVTKFDSSTVDFDETEVIPGYVEHGADPAVVNQRGGIWEITKDDNDLFKLVFVSAIDDNSVITVRYGGKYGGNKLQYKFDIDNTLATVPNYVIVDPAVAVQPAPTTFDVNSTRFVNAIDLYEVPDEGDKYLKFPKYGVFS